MGISRDHSSIRRTPWQTVTTSQHPTDQPPAMHHLYVGSLSPVATVQRTHRTAHHLPISSHLSDHPTGTHHSVFLLYIDFRAERDFDTVRGPALCLSRSARSDCPCYPINNAVRQPWAEVEGSSVTRFHSVSVKLWGFRSVDGSEMAWKNEDEKCGIHDGLHG